MQNAHLIEKIKNLSKSFLPEFISVRRHLHAYPELSFQEDETSKYLRKYLISLGVDTVKQVANTGLLATIQGKSKGPSVLLRSDMDALPITEENTFEFASQNLGVMHACGHDAHVASLLMCAKILMQLKNEFAGEVQLLFQPAEELWPGGATKVLEDKVYKDLGAIPHVGQHVRPDLPVGKVGFRSGKFMASMDEIFLTVKGKGGHAAMPEIAVDPVLISSHIIVAAQQLVSRMASPKTPSVLSFGKVIADGAINVLPNEVYIEGTFRTMDETWRLDALKKLEKLIKGIADSMGGTAELTFKNGYPHLINDSLLTPLLHQKASEYLGAENVVEMEQWMAAEDFAYYSQNGPSCFYMLGVGNIEKGIASGLHTPTFNIDEQALEIGGGLMAYLALSQL
ncbi:M20 metallopeptidase family protein [Euzebyella saccharophila]|uniref:M20 family metallopeptidase n=1 Tax=Euzebyella saccharophila TaxID=679664 RepID=A0ABV8JMN7_9FLAO|nr:M20 family metallopeptidase [Euzebyella saccharophila]